MKNTEPVETPGYFWLPETPNEKIPGSLRISNSGEVSMELFRVLGNFESEINKILNREHENISRVCGMVRDGGAVTLIECAYQSFESNLSGGIDKVVLDAQIAFVGIEFKQNELSFTNFDFWVEGFSEWLSISGITATSDISNGSGSIEFRRPEPIPHNLPDGTIMKFEFSLTGPAPFSPYPLTEARVTQVPYVSLYSTDPKPIEYFTSLATKFTKFLSLVVDQNVQIQTVKVNPKQEANEEVKTRYFPVNVYRAFHPTSDRDAQIHRLQILFTYSNIKDFNKMISKWLKNYDATTYATALDSYFVSRSSAPLPLTTRFLNLCQSVEALHTKMFPDERIMPRQDFDDLKSQIMASLPSDCPEFVRIKIESANFPSLRDRLEKLLDPFEDWFRDGESSKDFARRVADTRNSLTHLHDRHGKQARNEQELWNVYDKLDTLALLYVLMLLGLDEHDLVPLVQETTSRLNRILTIDQEG